MEALSTEKATLIDQVKELQKALAETQTPPVPAVQQENTVPPAAP